MADPTVQDEPDTQPEARPAAPAIPAQAPASVAGECVFNDSITVFPATRIPHYDKGPVCAYAARGTDKAPPNLFAMICEDHLAPRSLKAGNYASILNPSLPRLIASGVIDWTPAGKQKYCFIFENILGNPLMKDDLRGGAALKPDVVLNAVIKPLVTVLQDMRDKDIVHGNIRPSNIFDGGSCSLERAVLGECLSTPISSFQPSLYEPIDRALCSQLGKGLGTLMDDMYAFGVTLAMLLRHHDTTSHLSAEEIVERKMEEGSYITLLGRDRLSGAILELMRGLLYDDENQRWTLDDVIVWMDGRRLSPKQAARRSKANRPLHFNGEKYIRPELLARDLHKNISEARQIIDSGDMEQWLTRALEDKVITARYESVILKSQEEAKGSSGAEVLITRTAIALYPEGPIRYRGINIFPEGIGASLAEAYILKKDVQSYIDFFNAYFIAQWVDSQSRPVPDATNLVGKYDSARAFLRQKGFGGGLEKCIYTLNPELHCLSERLQKYHVRTPEDLMLAYEKMSRNPGRPTHFLDRHIVAFLSVKDRKNIDPYIHDLNAPEPYKRILAEIKTLATIQKRSQMTGFPGIASWVVENLKPVYERFHDRELQKEISKKVDVHKESGDLGKIVGLFDNPATYQQDFVGFRKAMRQYYDLEEEGKAMERALAEEGTYGRDTGQQVAAVIAGIIAGIIILATVFLNFNGTPSLM